jgi:hypothetical protein
MGHRRRASVAFTVEIEVVTIQGLVWRGSDLGAGHFGGRRGFRGDNLRATDPAARTTLTTTA